MDAATTLQEVQRKLRNDPVAAVDLALHMLAQGIADQALTIEYELAVSRGMIHQGKYKEGEPHAEKALVLSKDAGFRKLEGLSHNELGIYRFVENEFDAALATYALAEQLLQQFGGPRELAKVYINVGNVFSRRRMYFEAANTYERVLTIIEGGVDRLTEAKVLMNLAALYQHVLYDAESSKQCNGRALEVYRELNDKTGLAKALYNLAQVLRTSGEVEQCVAVYREALELRKQFSEPSELAMNYAGLALALIDLNRLDEAEHLLDEGEKSITAIDGEEMQVNFLLLPKAELLSARGDVAAAIDALHRMREWASEETLEEFTTSLLQLEAHALWKMGDYKAAGELLLSYVERASVELQERTQIRLIQVQRQIEHARLLGREEAERARSAEMAGTIRRMQAMDHENQEYMAFLAHELKNPLSTIRTVAGLLASDPNVTIDERREYNGEILSIATRMFDMVTRVLSGSRTNYIQSFAFGDVRVPLQHAVSSTKTTAQQKGIRLDVVVPPDPVSSTADDHTLHSIFDNLISNAIKFTPTGGLVKVRLQTTTPVDAPPSMIFSVQDSGPGLTSEDKLQLFQAFATLTARPTARESSTGLGLHLVRRAVDQLGGRVWCDSELGSGATFSVEVPLTHVPS